MSRHLSVATAIEKNKIASDIAFIMLVAVAIRDDNGDVVDHLYLAKNTEDVTYQGQVYTAANFEVKVKMDVEEEPSMSVDADDPSGFIRERMDAYGGGVGSDCTLIVLNTGNMTQTPEIEETFQVTGASQQGYKVSFQLGIENPLRIQWPRRRQYRDQCPFIFKGVLCGYAGPETRCTFTYDGPTGCKAKGNQERFGGFRGLQSIYLGR